MQDIKTGITAREIMDKNFPIVDSSLPLIKCVKRLNKDNEACLIVKNGYFSGVLGHDELLRGLMYSKNKGALVGKMVINKDYIVVGPDSDLFETLLLMKENKANFAVVKRGKNFLGLITKKEIADVEPVL
jgi:predicted transcriptional regulator